MIGQPNLAPVANGQDQITTRNIAKAITLTGSDANSRPDHVHDRGPAGTRHVVGDRCATAPTRRRRTTRDGLVHVPCERRCARTRLGDREHAGGQAVRHHRVRQRVREGGLGTCRSGSTVTWTNIGSNPHNVTDSSGMGLFELGQHRPERDLHVHVLRGRQLQLHEHGQRLHAPR